MTEKKTPKDKKVAGKGKSLVIVESPAKAKTINKYLGSSFVVKASMGHVRDLPTGKFGVELDKQFEPTYQILSTRTKVVDELKKYAKTADEIYLATDLDREGEAIAWHLAGALGIPEENAKRVMFNEITKRAIQQAFENPQKINMDKVNAQQARRILDRIVGYQLSPLLWKKIAKNLSAGRVQSVAVRLIVDREQEIEIFIPEESWEISVILHAGQNPNEANNDYEKYLEECKKKAQEDQEAKALSQSETGTSGLSIGDRLRHPHTDLILEIIGVNDPSLIKFRTKYGVEGQIGRKAVIQTGSDMPKDSNVLDESLRYLMPIVKKQKLVLDKHLLFKADLIKFDGNNDKILTDRQANNIVSALKNAQYQITSIQKKQRLENPSAPFTTATLQQQAATRLGFATQRTMRIAQQLYEGIDLGTEGPAALITYMRTDSTHLAPEAISAVRKHIGDRFGSDYLPEKPKYYSASKSAQEAHEAIRPTDVNLTPEDVKRHLEPDQFALYDLIWRRFVACQMNPAKWDVTEAVITATAPNHTGEFKAVGRILAFPGFLALLPDRMEGADANLPLLERDKLLQMIHLDGTQHFTQPLPRFNEASLVRTLEAQGIGRPSTYASIISTIQDRNYAEKKEAKFFPTDLGKVVTIQLIEHFPVIMDIKFTSHMEEQFDKIEEAHLDWVSVLNEFYEPFSKSLEQATKNMEKQSTQSEYPCELCGKPMVYKWTKTGRFLACSGYPDCKNAMSVDEEGKPKPKQTTEQKCPKCEKPMVVRSSRFGTFLGCSGYPECKTTIPCDKEGNPLQKVKPDEVKINCPQCGKPMAAKRFKGRSFMACTGYPDCKTTQPIPDNIAIDWPEPIIEKTDIKCDKCGAMMVKRFSKRGPFLGCGAFPKCRNIQKLPTDKTTAVDAVDETPKTAKPKREPKKLELTDIKCEKCGSQMAVRHSARGTFLGCSKYPKCKTTAQMPETGV
ncbi:MAG: type I DNA topoisomerase [Phycisphaerae bacterium]